MHFFQIMLLLTNILSITTKHIFGMFQTSMSAIDIHEKMPFPVKLRIAQQNQLYMKFPKLTFFFFTVSFTRGLGTLIFSRLSK